VEFSRHTRLALRVSNSVYRTECLKYLQMEAAFVRQPLTRTEEVWVQTDFNADRRSAASSRRGPSSRKCTGGDTSEELPGHPKVKRQVEYVNETRNVRRRRETQATVVSPVQLWCRANQDLKQLKSKTATISRHTVYCSLVLTVAGLLSIDLFDARNNIFESVLTITRPSVAPDDRPDLSSADSALLHTVLRVPEGCPDNTM